jgi:hypothetical protein
LSVWLGRKTSAAFALPPMLLSSWSLIATASARDSKLVPHRSLSSRIAGHVLATTVWLEWRSDQLFDSAPTTARRPTRLALIRNLAKHLATFSASDLEGMSDLETAVLHALKQGAQSAAMSTPAKSSEVLPGWKGSEPLLRRARGIGVAGAQHLGALQASATHLVTRLGVPAASVDQTLMSIIEKLAHPKNKDAGTTVVADGE